MTYEKFDLYCLRRAYLAALQESTDPSTQNGAVLVDVDKKEVLVEGANHFPIGEYGDVEEKAERWERPLKYQYVEHAERDVIYRAAKAGISTNGLHLYVPWYSCSDCARAIIEAGIVGVVGHQQMFDQTPERWKDSIRIGFQMLDEAQVNRRNISGNIGIQIRFNGELWLA